MKHLEENKTITR